MNAMETKIDFIKKKIEFRITVELGNKELFGRPKIVPYSQKFLILMK